MLYLQSKHSLFSPSWSLAGGQPYSSLTVLAVDHINIIISAEVAVITFLQKKFSKNFIMHFLECMILANLSKNSQITREFFARWEEKQELLRYFEKIMKIFESYIIVIDVLVQHLFEKIKETRYISACLNYKH